MLSFEYEDGIKIKNKYFATIYELHICPIKPSAPQSHETIPLSLKSLNFWPLVLDFSIF
jgi:hypothetical protein